MKRFFSFCILSCLALIAMAADATTPTEYKAENLIIFQSKTAVKSGWFWKDNGSGKVYNTTVKSKSGDWTISYYNNKTNSFNKCIPFSGTGTDGSSSWPNLTKVYNNDIVKSGVSDADGNWLIKVSSTSSMTQSAFTHLGATIALSAEQIETNQTVTITCTDVQGSLCHQTNDKWNIFVRKDAGDLVRLSGTTENFTGFTNGSSKSFTPTEAGSYTLYIYLTDPYDFETVMYEKTLTVNSDASTHTITYKANGGTGDDVVDDNNGEGYAKDASVTLKPANTFTREGYSFTKWNDGTTDYDAGASFTMPNKDVTMSAKWNIISYTITYVLPEGATNNSSNPASYTIESNKITLKDATQTGKIFEGWFTSDEYTEESKVTEIAKGSTGDRTFYAKFRDLKTYRLYYSNPEGWTTVKAYLWQNSNTSNQNAAWPGEVITSNTVVINNRTYYYYEFDETKTWDRVIFNNGSAQTGDITFSAETNNNQFNNAKASATGTWQDLPEPFDPSYPRTTVQVLCDYADNVKIFFLNKSADFYVIDAHEDGTSSEYPMNHVGEGQQTIGEHTGYLYEVQFVGTCKMAVFVSNSHIGTNNKLTANDVDLTAAAKVVYYYDLTGVTAGNPETDQFEGFAVPLNQGYATFCYPQPVEVSDAVAFWMTIEENAEEECGYDLVMHPIEDNIIPANTGVLLYSKEQNEQASMTVLSSAATPYSNNDFLGTTARTAMPADLASGEHVYVLGGLNGVGFYRYEPTSGYIPAYKAYFRLTPAAEPAGAAQRVRIVFAPQSPTNIEEQTATQLPVKFFQEGYLYIRRGDAIYTISGQRLK